MRAGVGELSILSMLVACGPGGGPGDDANPVMMLTVAPATATLESIDHAVVSQDFTVRATYADGQVGDVTDQVGWNVDATYGGMTGARFTTTGQVGGVATVSATLDAAVGTAQVTINIRTTLVDPSAPPNAADLFMGVDDPTRAPAVIYPSDQVVVPANIGDFDVHWADGSNNDVWEISLKSAHADIRVYVGAAFPRWYAFNAQQWLGAAGSADTVAAAVRGVSTAVPGQIGSSAAVTAILPDQPIAGGLYYWASGTGGACAGICGIYRHDLALPQTPAERFYTVVEEPQNRCVACHVLSRDGTRMALTYDGGDGPATVMDVASRSAAPSPGGWNFAAYAPDASLLVTSQQGTLTLRDGAGTPLATVPAAAYASHPDFAPAGTAIAYTLAPGMAAGANDWNVSGGQIVVHPFDMATRTFGVATPLPGPAGNNYYPSFSPDSAWIVFDHADAGASYNNGNAELWTVPVTGGTPMRLDRANVSVGLTNSWTRWAPFEQTVNGERMFWITFSTTRQFGNRLAAGVKPQIWMAAFFPDRAGAGTDPTAPSFWLPFQDINTNNHIAQWTESVIPIE